MRIWSAEQKIQIAILKGHRTVISSICYVAVQPLIISGDTQSELIMWSFTSHTVLKDYNVPMEYLAWFFQILSKI